MSGLMNEMDTSMGLSFSLEWKPRKPENDTELEVGELEKILLRDHALLTLEDIEKVAQELLNNPDRFVRSRQKKQNWKKTVVQ